MSYWTEPASGPLGAIIDAIWYCELPDASGHELVLPTARAQIIFGLDSSDTRTVIQGPATNAAVIDRRMQRRALGIVFRDGGLANLTPIPLDEIADRHLAGADVLGRHVTETHEQLGTADDKAIAGIAQSFVARLASLADQPDDNPVARAASLLARGGSVDAAGRAVGLGSTALTRRMRQRVGVRPKEFARVRRFERAVAATRGAAETPLSQIAIECGYADQAHMTREFRSFAGATPGDLRRHGDGPPNHLVVE